MTSKKSNDKPKTRDNPGKPSRGSEADSNFLRRWSERKAEDDVASLAQSDDSESTTPDPTAEQPEDVVVLTDDDMPSLDSLNEKSDFSVFMSGGVSDGLRQAAIRKMMHLTGLHPRDGLDDYDDDFRSFQLLGDTVTSDMKYQVKHEKKLADERAEAERIAAGEQSPQELEEEPASDETRAELASPDTADTAVAVVEDDAEPLAFNEVTVDENLLGSEFDNFRETLALPSAALIDWPQNHSAGKARAKALAAFDTAGGDATGVLIDYMSNGRILVFGSEARVATVRDYLNANADSDSLPVCALVLGVGDSGQDSATYMADGIEVTGHLGAFDVTAVRGGERINLGEIVIGAGGLFDIVVDVGLKQWHPAQTPPPGYIDACGDYVFSDDDLADLKFTADDLVGDFSKPRYFNYDVDICAHGRSGIKGCTRCIDACPTLAIRSIGELVEVDPYLCQGGGTCASVCPTGAMTYLLPTVQVLGRQLHAALNTWFEHEQAAPSLLFYDEAAAQTVSEAAATLPESVLPIAVEEVGAVGATLVAWCLASGVGAVRVLTQSDTPARVMGAISEQHAQYWPILEPFGLDPSCWSQVKADDAEALSLLAEQWPMLDGLAQPAQFALSGDKRNDLRMVVEHLRRVHDVSPGPVALPVGSSFGTINVDTDACTLCMACAGVCPPAAIEAGGDTPALRFTEWNCVQCGTCEKACPEQAITLEPRFVFENDQRMSRRTLNEDEPFACVSCGKPFATASVMKRMEEKLAGHWMFSDPAKMNRLRMCEDCRVKDMFEAEGKLQGHRPS